MKTTRVSGVFLLVAISACAIDDTAGPPQLGAPIPGYTAATLEGDSVSLSSLRGEVVLLNLWAPGVHLVEKRLHFSKNYLRSIRRMASIS